MPVLSERVEHANKRVIRVGDSATRIEGKHPGRNTLEDRFNVATSLLQRSVGGTQITAGFLNLETAALQFLSHAVKGANQIANLVSCADVHAVVQTATGNLLRSFRQRSHRTSNQFRQKQR